MNLQNALYINITANIVSISINTFNLKKNFSNECIFVFTIASGNAASTVPAGHMNLQNPGA